MTGRGLEAGEEWQLWFGLPLTEEDRSIEDGGRLAVRIVMGGDAGSGWSRIGIPLALTKQVSEFRPRISCPGATSVSRNSGCAIPRVFKPSTKASQVPPLT